MCKFCKNPKNISELQKYIGTDYETEYCPVCGNHLSISAFINHLFEDFIYKPPIETVEIDGQTLIVDRESRERDTEGLCTLDWENTNIDRELGWLKGEQK